MKGPRQRVAQGRIRHKPRAAVDSSDDLDCTQKACFEAFKKRVVAPDHVVHVGKACANQPLTESMNSLRHGLLVAAARQSANSLTSSAHGKVWEYPCGNRRFSQRLHHFKASWPLHVTVTIITVVDSEGIGIAIGSRPSVVHCSLRRVLPVWFGDATINRHSFRQKHCSMPSSFLQIDANAKTPLHEQIFKRMASLIAQGRMEPGSRAPSLRTLAMELGVARGTVESAYDRLIGEGYLVARGPAGTFVAERLPDAWRGSHAMRQSVDSSEAHAAPPSVAPWPAQPIPQSPPVASAGDKDDGSWDGGPLRASRAAEADQDDPRQRMNMKSHADSVQADPFGDLDSGPPTALQMGLPALDEFPRKVWSRLIARQARSLTAASLVKPDPAGLPRLREALAVYLHRARGVEAQADQVFIVAGYEAGLALAAEALLARGDTAVVECPSYPPTSRILEHFGLKVRRAPVDEFGLQVGVARKRASATRLVVTTPTHQSPLGVALSMERRMELLAWAAQAGIWVVEDDYDGEYRYRGHPLPALKSLDREERVIYAGTLSKVLYPGLRLAYLVVPQAQVGAFRAATKRALHGGCPALMQAVVADFIEEGHFARHIRKMRSLYARRRAWLADALGPYETHGMRVTLRDGGMHLLIELPIGTDDVACARRALDDGLAVLALTPWRADNSGPAALLASFTNIESASAARALAARLASAIGIPTSN